MKNLRFGFLNKGRLGRSLAVGAAVAGLSFASSAFAGFSTVNGAAGSEDSQGNVFSHLYGGFFNPESDGVDYTNGYITALRVDDSLPLAGSADSPGYNGTDQVWKDSQNNAMATAVFAGTPTSPFGYIPGASGGAFTALFPITGTGYSVTGSGSFSLGSTPFRFGAENPFGMLSSLPSDNKDGKDHMVTYEINGLADGASFKTWLLFFDDYGINGDYSDFDYQDLVIQVKTVPSSVPEPGSLMIFGGVALTLLKRIPRRLV